MSYRSYLDSLQSFGIHLGLERIQALLRLLGNPHEAFAAIHVAGTNGKGSVCAYLGYMLQTAGYRVGRYTSPHLIDWNERIWIDGTSIAPECLETYLERVAGAAIELDAGLGVPTQFETFTAAAFLAFAEAQIEVAVIEVGLGGRLDATNVFEHPLVSVITSIGLDHCDRLGDSLAAIAAEKAGILRPTTPLVVAPLEHQAQQVVSERAAVVGSPVTVARPARPIGPGIAEWEGMRYRLPLAGNVQLQNSGTALSVCRILQTRGWNLPDECLICGLETTIWPGRYQWIDQHLLIDGTHNPQAAIELRRYLDSARPGKPIRWVVGIMQTKDAPAILAPLLRPGDSLVAVPVPDAAFWPLPTLVHLAEQLGVPGETQDALAEALVGRETQTTVLCGSLYLIGEFLRNHPTGSEAWSESPGGR